jgi:hypothetical protein
MNEAISADAPITDFDKWFTRICGVMYFLALLFWMVSGAIILWHEV